MKSKKQGKDSTKKLGSSKQNSGQKKGQDEDSMMIEDAEENPSKPKEGLRIKRPIIFICNDLYSKSLAELRKKAVIFNFRKPETKKLLDRLNTICKKEVMTKSTMELYPN